MFKIIRWLFIDKADRAPAPKLPVVSLIAPPPGEEFDWSTLLPPQEEIDALRQFMLAVSAHLGVEESRRIAQTVADYFADPDLLELGAEPDREVAVMEGHDSCFLSLDWKQWDYLEPAANAELTQHGLTDKWHWTPNPDRASVPLGLHVLATWAAERGLALMHIRLVEESYDAFFVEADRVQSVLDLAHAAQLDVSTHEAFHARHAAYY
jgi:hypothetical protein